MDPRDLYKIIRALDTKVTKAITACACGGNCKCNTTKTLKESVQSPLTEEAEDNIDRFVLELRSSDEPFEQIYDGLLGLYGEEVEGFLQPKYEHTAHLHGWHPDDDFEQIINEMVGELTDDMDAQELASGEDEQDIEPGEDSLTDIKTLAFGNDN